MEKDILEIMEGDGNAFAIMGRVTKALKSEGATKEDIAKYRAEATSGDYDNLIRISGDWLSNYGYE